MQLPRCWACLVIASTADKNLTSLQATFFAVLFASSCGVFAVTNLASSSPEAITRSTFYFLLLLLSWRNYQQGIQVFDLNRLATEGSYNGNPPNLAADSNYDEHGNSVHHRAMPILLRRAAI